MVQHGIDPINDMDKENYWAFIAQRAQATVERAQGDNDPSLRLASFELLAATPLYVFSQHALSVEKTGHSEHRKTARLNACLYNGLIRDFAYNFPEASPEKLERTLVNNATLAIEDRRLQRSIGPIIHGSLIGAQHEIGFGQLLAATGRDFYSGSTQDDLKGTDYFVESRKSPGGYVSVDVKASLNAIRQETGMEQPFVKHLRDQITMYSLLHPQDFHDSFYISDAVIAARAPLLDKLLTEAEYAQATA